MNQEEQEGATATSSSRVAPWGRRSRDDSCYDEMEPYKDVGSSEDTSTASVSEYMGSGGATPPTMPSSAAGKASHMGSPMSYHGGSGAPCGACKFLRRKCVKDCVFAPYFGAEHGAARFAAVHKIFGASNVNKLLRSIPAQKRFDAVITISYEAQARITNPVYGCVAHIADLQQQVQSLQAELSFVHAQLTNSRQLAAVSCMALQHQQQQQQQQQGGHIGGPFMPFGDQTQTLDPMHMQQLICPQISSPPPLASYNRPKDELENPLQPCMHHLYDSLSMGAPPTPPVATSHLQQAHHEHEHHHPHLSIDLTQKSEDVDVTSSVEASRLHALLRTQCLNLRDSS